LRIIEYFVKLELRLRQLLSLTWSPT